MSDLIDRQMKFPTYEEMGREVAERALDDFLVNDKTLREWINLMSKGMIPDSIIGNIKEDIESCRGKFYRNEDNTCSPYMEGTLNEVIKIIDKHISE